MAEFNGQMTQMQVETTEIEQFGFPKKKLRRGQWLLWRKKTQWCCPGTWGPKCANLTTINAQQCLFQKYKKINNLKFSDRNDRKSGETPPPNTSEKWKSIFLVSPDVFDEGVVATLA